MQQPRENKNPSSSASVPIHPFASKQGGNVTWTSWLPGSYKPTDQRPAVPGIDDTAAGHSTLLSWSGDTTHSWQHAVQYKAVQQQHGLNLKHRGWQRQRTVTLAPVNSGCDVTTSDVQYRRAVCAVPSVASQVAMAREQPVSVKKQLLSGENCSLVSVTLAWGYLNKAPTDN